MTSRQPATDSYARVVLAARLRRQRRETRQAVASLRIRDCARMSQLRLRLSASPDEVAFARAAITRLCEHFQLADAQTENIRLAVTEACSNCVLHAYDRQTGVGTYVLDARVDNDALHITVCDSGVGVHNAQATVHRGVESGLGSGLYLIRTLADSAEISTRPSGGTRVVMRFAISA
jgi:stage II sporulation protein AB (anti-sigma F factor)